MSNLRKYYIYSFIFLTLTSCETYQKVLKSPDANYKLSKAHHYYDKGDFAKALPLFEELITLYKGTRSIDEIYYLYAMCHYEMDDFLIAGFHFKNIHDSYPLSKYAEECLYMNAYCYFRLSPNVNLDQTYTEKAIDAFQLYINSYPNSEKIKECNMLMAKLRRKLETKSYNNAELYYKMSDYKAAATSFANLLKNYPDTKDAEKAHLYIIKSYYHYAQLSIADKQEERYQLAVKAYNEYADKFKDNSYQKEAAQIYESSLENINKLNNKN